MRSAQSWDFHRYTCKPDEHFTSKADNRQANVRVRRKILFSLLQLGDCARRRPWLLKFLVCAFLLPWAIAVAPSNGRVANRGTRVLVFYTDKGEPDHVEFARQALRFLKDHASRDKVQIEFAINWKDLNEENLKNVRLVIWLNDFPTTPEVRSAFEQYMEGGGGWLGFHVSAYNDADTHWPWFVKFLGGGAFYGNNWPPLTAKLNVDAPGHPVTRQLPLSFTAPSNEWYIWRPSPRENPDVQVLLTLDAKNYPMGLKDTITAGDLPVVWTNKRYRMVYMNMGHGDKIFASDVQNRLIENSLLWLSRDSD
jgi:type 1 glutamine amidotransferase